MTYARDMSGWRPTQTNLIGNVECNPCDGVHRDLAGRRYSQQRDLLEVDR